MGMKKALGVILVLVLGVSGFLYYDWHAKTKKQASEPSIPQYSWTDAQGARHFTDRPPPKGATNIQETKGYKSVDPPLVVTIQKKVVETYHHIKKKLFKPKKKRRDQ
jgi:Domain of unknown function (DUF4124)